MVCVSGIATITAERRPDPRGSGRGRRAPGAGPVRRARVTGPVRCVRATRPGKRPALRAEVASERGGVTVIWLGRTHIPGVEPGRVLAVEGTLSVQRGRPTIYNPRYDLGAEQRAAT